MQCAPIHFDDAALIGPAERFNPALARAGGEIIMVYRTGMGYEGRLFAGRLDAAFQPLSGSFQELQIGVTRYHSYEDPRLLFHRGQLHLYFTGYSRRPFSASPMIAAFYPAAEAGDSPPGLGTIREPAYPNRQEQEKNWVFFDHAGQLFATYWMAGGRHHVVSIEEDRALPRYETCYASPWKWGQQRGGTNLVEHEGLCWGFFHSRVTIAGTLKYFMGAYAMEPRPPFRIVRMSATPLFTSEETQMIGDRFGTRVRKQVIFPSGLLLDGRHWIVAAGYNDRRIVMFRLSHLELERSMIDVSVASENEGIAPAAMFGPETARPVSGVRIRRAVRQPGMKTPRLNSP